MTKPRSHRVRWHAFRSSRPLSPGRLGALVLLLAACGGGSDAGTSDAAAADTEAPQLDACAVLAEVDAEAILGGPVDAAIPVAQMGDEQRMLSQCVISAAAGLANVSLMLRWSIADEVPATREEFIGREQGADVLGLGDEAAQALAAAEDVTGLGDLALFYEFAGHNLAVFWDRHYQMFVSILIDDRDAALRHARSIAERVLGRY